MFYAAIAMGHSVANHKILCSVGFYIVFRIAIQTVSSFLSIFGVVGAQELEIFTEEPDIPSLLHRFSIGSIVLSLVIGVVFYLLTRYTLKKKLNLQ